MFASRFDLVRLCSIFLHICKMNGYLARFMQDKGLSCKIMQDFERKSCKTMYRLARFCQNLTRSCKITIRCRLGFPVTTVGFIVLNNQVFNRPCLFKNSKKLFKSNQEQLKVFNYSFYSKINSNTHFFTINSCLRGLTSFLRLKF